MRRYTTRANIFSKFEVFQSNSQVLSNFQLFSVTSDHCTSWVLGHHFLLEVYINHNVFYSQLFAKHSKNFELIRPLWGLEPMTCCSNVPCFINCPTIQALCVSYEIFPLLIITVATASVLPLPGYFSPAHQSVIFCDSVTFMRLCDSMFSWVMSFDVNVIGR